MNHQVKIKFLNRRGFTLIELFIVMVIMIIFASFITMNMDSQKQTAQQEAEKLAQYLHDVMRKADRRHMKFVIEKATDEITWKWLSGNTTYDTEEKLIYKKNPSDSDKPIISANFTLDLSPAPITYNAYENEFEQKSTFTITRNGDSAEYYLHVKEGRLRLSQSGDPDA